MSTHGRSGTIENTTSIPAARPKPVRGDVLVSERTARADVYAISVIPGPPLVVARRYSDAIRKVRDLARERQVDGWYTGDHTHYAQVARYLDRVMGDRTDTAPALAETVRAACLDAAKQAYEDAGIRGLCADGQWEAALSAICELDLSSVHQTDKRESAG
jgi:hypothetical protein